MTIQARPTVYNGTRMRSRLEAYAAQVFDQAGQRWEYEPCCYASGAGQYLPDFRITDSPADRCPEYVEIKPQSFYRAHLDTLLDGTCPLLRRMEIIYASERRASLLLWFPESGEAFVSGWWDRGQWYHQGPGRLDLFAQVQARVEQGLVV